MALACLNPPGLKAMYVDCGGFSNAYQGGIRQGGAFELKQVTWAYNMRTGKPEVRNNPQLLAALKAVDIKAWFARMPWQRGKTPLSLFPSTRAMCTSSGSMAGSTSSGNNSASTPKVTTPIRRCRDGASLRVVRRLCPHRHRKLCRALRVKQGPVHLIMGPWTHGARSTAHSGRR